MAQIDWGLMQTPNFVGNALQALQAGEAQGRQRAIQDAYAGYAKGDENAVASLMALDPEQGMRLRGVIREDRRDQARTTAAGQYAGGDAAAARQTALEAGDFDLVGTLSTLDDNQRKLVKENNELVARALFPLQDIKTPEERAAAWATVKPKLAARGIDAATLDNVDLSDLGLSSALAESQTISDMLEGKRDERDFRTGREDRAQDVDFRGQQFDWEKQTDTVAANQRQQQIGLEGARLNLSRQSEARQAAQAAQSAGGGLTPAQARQQSMALRKEFNNLADVKNFNDVATSYDVISTLAKAKPTAANDLSLIFSYMKMLDPGSVVREGEFANAQNAASIPDRVRNAYNRAVSGQMLNPRQRNEFTQGAGNVYTARRGRYDQLAEQYQGYAGDVGLDGKSLIQPRPKPAATAPAAARPAAPKVGEVRQGFRFKGGDPANRANWVKQ